MQHHLQRKRNSQYHNDRQQIIEIIRERDEYPYSFEISQNSKGEAQLTAKIRMEKLDSGAVKDQFIQVIKELKEVCSDQGLKLAGSS